jgi:Pilus assembly protein, PilO
VSELLKTTKGQIGAGALALVLVLAAGWFLGVSPQKKKAADLRDQTNAAATELAQKKAALEHPAADVNIRASDGYLLKRALPDAVDMPGTLLDLERLAKRNHLDFSSVRPGALEAGIGYMGHPIDITIQGSFTKVSRFLGQLRGTVKVTNRRVTASGPIYSITKVDLGAPAAPDVFPVVKASVTINAFVFAAPVAGAAPTTPTTPSNTSNVAAGATP